jgi:putative ABC transport system substrate-binding protein
MIMLGIWEDRTMQRCTIGLLVALALAILVWPLAAAPPAGKVYRIGFLRAGQPPTAWVEAFQQGLREQGYIDGQNVVVEYRVTDGSLDPLPQLAEELVQSKVDVILASSSPPAVAAKNVTTSVPIVFVNVFDPVEIGLVPSLARPGGNITGIAATSPELAGKRLELLKELVPQLRRVAVLSHPATPSNLKQLQGAEDAARALGMQVQPVPVHGQEDFDAAFQAVRGADGLLLLDLAFFTTHRARLVSLAAASRLPAMYGYKEMADAGGLMSYGVHYPDLYRRAATYVDKILKGAKPADLPVEQPMKYEFVINLKTAQALGLTIPPLLLFLADEVIR